MPISLYSATVPSWLQTLRATAALLTKVEEHGTTHGLTPDQLLKARLADDMLPFAYQIRATTTHSLGAIEAVRAGVCHPDRSPPPMTIGALHDLVGETIATLGAIEADEVDSFVGKDMRFDAGALVLDFTAENFLLSFALPNFYFHAATAYDILRANGVQIGKRDFLGVPRVKV